MKLIVGGCSVSDRTEVDECYGEILARDIGVDYIHYGAGCGSNYRMWRKITKDIIDGNITKGDIVIIQYTQPWRDEYWSCYYKKENRFDRYGNIEYRDKYGTGDIIRWKPMMKGEDDNEYKFFELKEKFFTNIEYDLERFECNHFLFHTTLINKGINVIYFVPDGKLFGYNKKYEEYFNKNGEIHLTRFYDEKNNELLPDLAHMNAKGHEVTAKFLAHELRDRGLIK